MKTIILAGGCFWGVEEFFSRIPGVVKTTAGYANGTAENPRYEQVCTGETGHAEACRIEYDENTVGLSELLQKYWSVVDPTVKNRQGNDVGTQYRTGIFYTDPADLPPIESSRAEEAKKHGKPIVTLVEPLRAFYPAEEYHQRYLKKNPGGYCHIRLD